jgi:hypothetical protein
MTTNDLREAHARMAALAITLSNRFSPMEAVNILAGLAYGVLVRAFDPETARYYFEVLADAIEKAADGDDHRESLQ